MFSIRKIFAKKENMESNIAINREISQGGGIVLPIKKINSMKKDIMERKKMQELQNKIIGQGNNIALTKGVIPDPRKRQFIRKGILGIIAGIGIAVFSKITGAIQSISFPADRGIDFSNQTSPAAGMTSELLDRYEEGTFTPALKNGATGVTMSHSTQFGRYTRIGNRVHINLRVIVNGNGSADNSTMAIFGLPFTCDNTGGSETAIPCSYAAGLNLGTAGDSLVGNTDANGTAKFWIMVWTSTDGNSTGATRDVLSSDATLNFAGVYEVDS